MAKQVTCLTLLPAVDIQAQISDWIFGYHTRNQDIPNLMIGAISSFSSFQHILNHSCNLTKGY